VLLFGATGGCGSQVLSRLLARGVRVTAVVRSADRLSDAAKGHTNLKVLVLRDGHLALSTEELEAHVAECECAVSCLGHNLTFKGIYGRPHDLCVESVRRLCDAARRTRAAQDAKPLRLIVVSTEGVSRCDGADPKRSFLERALISALYFLLPPMKDNVEVVRYLHALQEMHSPPRVEFCAVRPSDMIDGDESPHEAYDTLQNGLFNAGNTTRANVGAFMADLVTHSDTWARWRNAFPHLLNSK